MPSRNHIHECVVLRARESPSGDRILSLLTAENGLIDVFVFGGPKSKLRSIASPYAEGRAFVYFDPVKDFRKLTDFDVARSNPGLRENLGRLWSAGLVAEILLKTSGGGGDFGHVKELAATTFVRLSEAQEEETGYPLILFLWRLLSVLGLGPDPGECVGCGAPASLLRPGDADSTPLYSASEEGFVCAACAKGILACAGTRGDDPVFRSRPEMTGLIPVTAGALKWLARSDEMSFDRALSARLDQTSLSSLKELVFWLAQRAADSPLLSLGRGMPGGGN